MKMETSPATNSIDRGPIRPVFVLIPVVLACFVFLPQARAVCQEGCLTNDNTVLGDDALLNNTGDNNTAVGSNALLNNTTGFFNTAVGSNALNANTVGIDNTAVGNQALFLNTTGGFNTGIGHAALQANTSGESNTAIGWAALAFNVTGGSNTAVGWGSLIGNTDGSSNTAVGVEALGRNTIGNFNTATGTAALTSSLDASNNTAYGFFALQIDTRGSNNTAVGSQALRLNKDGNNNTCLGNNSLYQCRGSNNTAIGTSAGIKIFSGNNDICISNEGARTESNTIRIGNETHTDTFIAGISGATVPTGVAVIVDADGHLGTITSSACYKESIEPMDSASEAIFALKPVTFRYKHDRDPNGIPQFGLVAEQVEKVDPDLVARDNEGKPYTVRYDAVNAMLLNEFLKAHKKIEEQEVTIAQLKRDLLATTANQQKQIQALSAGLQKVSAQLELGKPTTQTVLKGQ